MLAEVTALEAALEAETAKRRELHVTLFLTGTTDDDHRAMRAKAMEDAKGSIRSRFEERMHYKAKEVASAGALTP